MGCFGILGEVCEDSEFANTQFSISIRLLSRIQVLMKTHEVLAEFYRQQSFEIVQRKQSQSAQGVRC